MLIDTMPLVTLIGLNKKLKYLDDSYKDLAADNVSDAHRQIAHTKIFLGKARISYCELNRVSMQEVNILDVDTLFSWYTDFLSSFELPLHGRWWAEVKLSEPELTHMSPITFGQFIDAKMMVEAGVNGGSDKWGIVQYLVSIFCVGKKKYSDEYTYEQNAHFIRSGKITVRHAILVSLWWDKLNKYINDNYTLFQDSGDTREHSDNIDEHMKRWGWVNLLKNIAKTKAFDISGSGLNSIDCVRATKASDILVWASEEKEDAVARNRDMKDAYKQ